MGKEGFEVGLSEGDGGWRLSRLEGYKVWHCGSWEG